VLGDPISGVGVDALSSFGEAFGSEIARVPDDNVFRLNQNVHP
jgi:hypothetical protein